MSLIGENIRYLLWLEHRRDPAAGATLEDYIERESRWTRTLHNWMRCELAHAQQALEREDYEPSEVKSIAKANYTDPADLQQERMVDRMKDEIFYLNIAYLLDGLERGGKKQMCNKLGVDASTVTRWRSQTVPSRTQRQALARYFGLPEDVDLMTSPVFLRLEPVSVAARKEWLKRRIDDMASEDVRRLFPALRLLVGKR